MGIELDSGCIILTVVKKEEWPQEDWKAQEWKEEEWKADEWKADEWKEEEKQNAAAEKVEVPVAKVKVGSKVRAKVKGEMQEATVLEVLMDEDDEDSYASSAVRVKFTADGGEATLPIVSIELDE